MEPDRQDEARDSAAPVPVAVVHIAGTQVRVGPYQRQRCSWCGAVLCDHDLRRIVVLAGDNPKPAMWSPGDLVAVAGCASWVVPHEDGADLPPGSCGLLDPEVTL